MLVYLIEVFLVILFLIIAEVFGHGKRNRNLRLII